MRDLMPRDIYIHKIDPFLNKPIIKVLTGMRRTGKSALLKILINTLSKQNIPTENILLINKESLAFDFMETYVDLYTYTTGYFADKKGQKYLFVDEIQEIKNWEKAIASLLSDNLADIIITGSNAHLLSSELATLLTGRYIEIPIYPLNFSEFLTFRKATNTQATLEEEFSLFLKYGGFPGIHLFELTDETTFTYLNSLFNTILLKDVIQKHEIREPVQLEKITKFIFDNCGNISTAKRISNFLKSQHIPVSVDRVQNYLHYLSSAFLLYKVSRYDLKGLKHLELYEKYYMGDIGLRHGLIGYKDPDIDGILENIIYLELLSRGYKVSIGKLNDLEIDFIAENQHEKIYIQGCYLLAHEDTVLREFGALEKIKDNYRKIVLSLDKHFPDNRKGIEHMNLIEFLLKK